MKGEVPALCKNDERYLVQALEFEGALRAYLYRYTRNNSVADELLQEVYARLLLAAASDGPEVLCVRAFSLALSRNVAFEWMRNQEVVPIELIEDREAQQSLGDTQRMEEVSGDHELATSVQAIQKLPAPCRRVFTLRKVYGYSQREIASRLKMSERVVEQHLTHAARRCAQAVFHQPLPVTDVARRCAQAVFRQRLPELLAPLFERFRRRRPANVQGR